MKPLLMRALAWPNSKMSIIRGLCPRLDVQDVMGIPWSTSSQTNSPPAGRSFNDYRGEIGKMCEWYHRTLAGGTLALDAPLMLYVIRRFLRQVESRTVGGDVCALRDAMVELSA